MKRTKGTYACSLLCPLIYLLLAAPVHAANPIQIENGKPGTTAWELSNPATNREIEGYASLTSVNRGGQISLFVNTAEPSYTIEVFRVGWYGGTGARQMLDAVTRPGIPQPIPAPDPTTGLIECLWTDPYVLTIPSNAADPSDWASGVYLAKLTAGTSGKQSYIIFVVRDDTRPSSYLFQSSVTTFQAYNNWGGKSLYAFNSTGEEARKVSFNRPYATGSGAADFLWGWEINMLRWLEREGYDVTYITNVDTHADGNLLLSHKAFLSVGHDEYWSWEMRGNVEAARDLAVSMGFFSSNTCYWQIRFEPSPATGAPHRTMVGYKKYIREDPLYLDPSKYYLVTTKWRDPPVGLPEDALIGVMYSRWSGPVDADMVIEDASHWVFAGSGLQNGDRLTGLLGYEVDRMFGNAPRGTARITRSYDNANPAFFSDMTVYTAASGAIVFATGTMQWSWGLDDYNGYGRVNAAAQQITRNVLARFVGAGLDPSVTPSSQDFESVPVGSTADRTFTVQNAGGGMLTGSATTSAPFSIVSGGSYNLTAGQSQAVTVRFSPTSAGTFLGNVNFTGGGGASRTVTGVGVPAGASLSASPTPIPAGGTLTAAWSGIAAPTPTDWLALYAPGAADTAFLAWRYTTGAASDSMPFIIPATLAPGTYELRLFADNSYTRLATSNPLTVTVPAASLSVSPTSGSPGTTVTAAWSGIAAPTPTDWVGLYTSGAADTALLASRYTTGAASGSAALRIPASLAPGTYELRLFANDSFTRLATSNPLTVQ